jgi:hypothetical protein
VALIELFAYDRAQTTVTSGGTDAPVSGTVETWIVASSAMFGAAVTGVSQFHVADLFAPSEIIAVTNITGTTWTVTRGAGSTTPVPHAAGFLVFQTTTAGFLAGVAPLASPALTSVPTAPTASPLTGTTQIATTAYSDAAVALKAPLASPALTGTPTAPTASALTNSTRIATTAYTDSAVSVPAALAAQKAANLSDLASAAAARGNLGVPGVATAVTRLGGTTSSTAATQPFLNPVDYGAVFDGTTNDSPALAAVQAAANVAVAMPPATASVASPVSFTQSGERIRGAGMYSTTVRAASGLGSIFSQVASGYVSGVTLEDMTIDGASLATGGIHGYGYGIGRLTLRRCRFVNFPGSIIDSGYASEFVIEDCEAEGNGLAAASFFTATNKEFDSLILRRNKLRWMSNGVIVGSNGFNAVFVEIDDNDFEHGWMHTKALFAGSGGTVTYTSTTVTDTAASFSGINTVALQPIRAMPVLQTGTFTTVTGAHIADTSASFVSNGVVRNNMVRTGTSFAVVDAVESATTIHVREWLSQSTYLPVAPPSAGASYTVYGLLFLNADMATSTTITGIHGASGGGGGWYGLNGIESTPANGTLYEVPALGNYPLYLTSVTDRCQITNNRFRGGWADQIEHFGTRAVITDNICEDGNNYGIFTGSSSATPTLDKSVISGNIIKHNAFGLGITGSSDVEAGPNQYEDNGWGLPNGNVPWQVLINDSARITITGGNATNTAECLSNTVGLKITGANTADCKVQGFRGYGNLAGDIYVTSTVPAGTCELIDVSGVIAYQVTSNGQRLQVKGTGVPSLPASQGSTFLRTDGSPAATLYVKESASDGTGWDAMGIGTAYGQRVAYSAITSPVTATSASSTPTSMTAIPGAPSITLPNDSFTYRVTLSAPSMYPSAQQITAIGIGTAGTAILKYTIAGYSSELDAPCYVQVDVTGSSLSAAAVGCYAYASSGGNVTLGASAIGPAELSAVRVA